ncbi:hypothetical protein PAHAL_9G598300 [Panicum hallii]|uniref:Uncharacterized protein n=1 Tax=Panicum hallii TaxID=206008 RepID=A0A2T8I6D3_9POAL|nr:hypothetical protein PAHAL_9G598300 [Panicum hallii]
MRRRRRRRRKPRPGRRRTTPAATRQRRWARTPSPTSSWTPCRPAPGLRARRRSRARMWVAGRRPAGVGALAVAGVGRLDVARGGEAQRRRVDEFVAVAQIWHLEVEIELPWSLVLLGWVGRDIEHHIQTWRACLLFAASVHPPAVSKAWQLMVWACGKKGKRGEAINGAAELESFGTAQTALRRPPPSSPRGLLLL